MIVKEEAVETNTSRQATQEQYKTADNLHTRMSIHEKYSTNRQGFGNWILSQYDLPTGGEFLELGCGSGELWCSQLERLNGSRLFLTDFSEGMIAAAKKNLGEQPNLCYDVVDIEAIPYETGRFDRVIANMMLYHVPDLDKGLGEVRRVLKESGYFYCTTYGENGIVSYLAGLLQEYGIKDLTNKNFTLQNGQHILEKHFSQVRRLDYEDSLAITQVEDLLDYLYSMSSMASLPREIRPDLKTILEKQRVNGVLFVPKEYGMFICRK